MASSSRLAKKAGWRKAQTKPTALETDGDKIMYFKVFVADIEHVGVKLSESMQYLFVLINFWEYYNHSTTP